MFLLPFLFLFIVSCGPETPVEPGSQMERMIGTLRTLDSAETLSAQEAGIIQSICVNLRNKENTFRDYDTFNTKLVYSASSRACGAEEAVKQDPFSVEVEASGVGFVFKSEGAQPPFTDVVTSNDVVMGQVCSHIANALEQEVQPSRVISSGGSPQWIFGVPEGNPRCVTGDNAGCLYVEKGLSAGENRYRIQDVKFFAVNGNVGDELRGVALDRRQIRLCGAERASSEVRMSFVGLGN